MMTTTAAKNARVRLVWHRCDLRLHDNWLYNTDASTQTDDRLPIVSLYIFDETTFMPHPSTSRRNEWDAVDVGPFACRFLIESVADLRKSLKESGSTLLVRYGKPVDIIPRIIAQVGATEVYWNEEPGMHEAKLSQDLRMHLLDKHPSVQVRTSMGYTLYHPNDLPVGGQEWEQLAQPNKKRSKKKKRSSSPRRDPLPEDVVDVSSDRWQGMCRIMGDFRRAAREKTKPRPCAKAPIAIQSLPSQSQLEDGEIPTFQDLMKHVKSSTRPILGLPPHIVQEAINCAEQQLISDDTPNVFRGGETSGLSHLHDFMSNHAATATRNLACVANNESSHLSTYLAFGCLSPRRIVHEAEKQGEDCNWMISHMTMRDFFLYTCLASEKFFYKLDGIPIGKKKSEQVVTWKSWRDDQTQELWERWACGRSGLPLVDAAMRELRQTGYCSNRVRQNVASVLAKDLGIDWRSGAELFQFLLGDHCVGANWGNWLYFSGVGPDPQNRHFRTVSQALRYDEDGSYVRKWVDELSSVEDNESHLRPWDFSDAWPTPMVEPETQYTWHDLQRLKDTGNLKVDIPE